MKGKKRLGYSEARMQYVAHREDIKAQLAKGASVALIYQGLRARQVITMSYVTFTKWVKKYGDGFKRPSPAPATPAPASRPQERPREAVSFSKGLNMNGNIPPRRDTNVL